MASELPENREWLSYREAQLLTGLGRTTLWKQVVAGRLVVSKQGRTVRLLRRSLDDLMWQRIEVVGEDAIVDFDDGGVEDRR
jgi:hypothetical protein